MPYRMPVWGTGFLCLAVALLLMTVDTTCFHRKPTAPIATNQVVQQSAPPTLSSIDAAREELRHHERMLSEVSANVDAALKEIDLWNREVLPLRDNALGQEIAKDEELAKRFSFLLQQQRPDAKALLEVENRADASLKLVQRLALETTPRRLSFLEAEEAREVCSTARQARSDWQRAVLDAQAIVRMAQRSTNDKVADEPPVLKEVIDRLDDQNRLEQIDVRRQNAEAEAAKRAEEKRQVDLEREQRAQLVREATSPEVRARLAPFLEHRYLQPIVRPGAIRFNKTLEKQPMSLSRLQGLGALNEGIAGLERLARLTTSSHLPAPKWSIWFESRAWDAATLEMVKETQRMLREYGPILVEEGLLSK